MATKILSAALCGGAIAFAMTSAPAAAAIADALRPPPDEALAFVLDARGVQIYECQPRIDQPGTYRWAFVAPEATLLEGGAPIGHHGAGPTWESAIDGSSVKGVVRERQDGGAGNIPWLLLAAEASEHRGRFAGITSIQRLDTRGGVEPADRCDAASAGRREQVQYTATYHFYKRSPVNASRGPYGY